MGRGVEGEWSEAPACGALSFHLSLMSARDGGDDGQCLLLYPCYSHFHLPASAQGVLSQNALFPSLLSVMPIRRGQQPPLTLR